MESGETLQANDKEFLNKEQQDVASSEDAVEEDGTPVLDEQDLEEHNLTEEEADNIEWEEQ